MLLHEDKFEYLANRCRKTLLPWTISIHHMSCVYTIHHILFNCGIQPGMGQINKMLQKAKNKSAWLFNVFKYRNEFTTPTLYKSLEHRAKCSWILLSIAASFEDRRHAENWSPSQVNSTIYNTKAIGRGLLLLSLCPFKEEGNDTQLLPCGRS